MQNKSAKECDIERIQSELIGRRFSGASLASISLGTSGTSVIVWIKNNKNFLVYLGSPGSGKTYFCSALIPWIQGKVESYRYWKEGEYLSRIRKFIGEGTGDYLKEIEYMLDYDFIMLDDLGSAGINEWRKEIIFETIDRRYESENPTVITSNLTRKEILENFGPRTYSRLFAKENLILEFHEAKDLRKREEEG